MNYLQEREVGEDPKNAMTWLKPMTHFISELYALKKPISWRAGEGHHEAVATKAVH